MLSFSKVKLSALQMTQRHILYIVFLMKVVKMIIASKIRFKSSDYLYVCMHTHTHIYTFSRVMDLLPGLVC